MTESLRTSVPAAEQAFSSRGLAGAGQEAGIQALQGAEAPVKLAAEPTVAEAKPTGEKAPLATGGIVFSSAERASIAADARVGAARRGGLGTRAFQRR
jgi:hypothetical protein